MKPNSKEKTQSSRRGAKTTTAKSAKPPTRNHPPRATDSPRRAESQAPVSERTTVDPGGAPAPASPSSVTSVVARIDVGFGNQLFIRGEGGGLAWDHGLPMECVDSSEWHWRTAGTEAPLVFKILLNDERWSQGENFVALPGQRAEIRPALS